MHEPNAEAGVCDGKPHDSDSDRRGGADVLTGSFFPSGPASAPGNAARVIAPSFDCAKAENADEEEICADPDLAQADRDIARIYAETMRRLDRKFTDYLRTDQRGWAADNASDYLANLQPGSDKAQSTVHHTSVARRQLFLRQQERMLMLANLDEKRKGLEGYWLGYDAALSITAGKRAGTLHAQGGIWDVEDYKSHCDFAADGKIENGTFKTDDEFPKLTREAGTLMVDVEGAGKSEDEPPGYCSRMRSPNARLFPVKAGSGVEEIGKQLR